MAVGFSVFRRRRNGKPAKRYTIRLRLPDGSTRDVAGFSDKAATTQRAAQLVREIERREVGLHDQFADSRRAPIAEHVEAFLVAMQNGSLSRRRRGRVSPDWVARCRKRLVAMLAEMGATRLEHLELAEAEKLLHEHASGAWSATTRDHHASLLRQFGAWLLDVGRWSANPFHRLRPIADQSTRTFRRWALTVEQLRALAEAAETRGVQQYAQVNPRATAEHMDRIRFGGFERSTLFQVAAYTGLRRGEILRLRWADLVRGAEPAVVVRAATAKNRRESRIEMPRWIGERLEELRVRRAQHDGRPPAESAPLFRASYRHVTERLKLDAVYARIGEWDATRSRVLSPDGRVIDFHALRGTCATIMDAAGVSPKTMQDHMRHSDLRTTMDSYVMLRRSLMRESVERMPTPRPPNRPLPAGRVITDTDASCRTGDEDRRSGT